MNRIPDRFVSLPNCGRPWRPRIDWLHAVDYYGAPAPVNRLPPPPPVPVEAREVALTVSPPRYYGTLADDLRALELVYGCCERCGARPDEPCDALCGDDTVEAW